MSIEPSRYGPDFHCVTVSRDVFEVRSHYANLRPVGGGSYGIVCSAEDTLRGRKVAIKKITDVFDDLTDAKRILREMKLLRHLGVHENIINVGCRPVISTKGAKITGNCQLTRCFLQILDVILIPPNVMDFHDIYIVTDLMESDLERIISSSQPLSDAHFQYFLYQILRGMKFHGFYPKRPLIEFFPDANPLAVDLLSQMLKFNPAERISVVQALAHPYLAQLQNPADEPVCAEPFNFDFERESLDLGVEMPKEELQRLVFQECMSIHQLEAHHMH
ncbi:Protein kinase, ATP binding site [Phytophthora cactorum]|nr:Protein kinase, ATP binding site [Phytophthora cactorum]